MPGQPYTPMDQDPSTDAHLRVGPLSVPRPALVSPPHTTRLNFRELFLFVTRTGSHLRGCGVGGAPPRSFQLRPGSLIPSSVQWVPSGLTTQRLVWGTHRRAGVVPGEGTSPRPLAVGTDGHRAMDTELDRRCRPARRPSAAPAQTHGRTQRLAPFLPHRRTLSGSAPTQGNAPTAHPQPRWDGPRADSGGATTPSGHRPGLNNAPAPTPAPGGPAGAGTHPQRGGPPRDTPARSHAPPLTWLPGLTWRR